MSTLLKQWYMCICYHVGSKSRENASRFLLTFSRVHFGVDDLVKHFRTLADEDQLPSLDELDQHAVRLYSVYSTTPAYERALDPCATRAANPALRFPLATSIVAGSGAGDWALANSILLICDGIWFLEVCHTVASGDIGRVWEVFKVSISNAAGQRAQLTRVLDMDLHFRWRRK